MSNQERKRVFISYGHKDGFDFVRRLAFSLEMYVKVFWDKRLGVGKFDEQLYAEIDKCDFLIIVMTPYALRKGGWCRREIKYAEENNKPIVPIKLHNDCGFDDIESWISITSKDQYADFTKNFDAGFQGLTQILLGHPYLSWEYFTHLSDTDLLQQLDASRLPDLIAKELAEWVLVHKAWNVASYYIKHRYPDITLASPTTISGLKNSYERLKAEAQRTNNVILFRDAEDIEHLIKTYEENLLYLDTNKAIFKLMTEVYEYQINDARRKSNILKIRQINETFYFDVAEKLRELINIHARRSRYLY